MKYCIEVNDHHNNYNRYIITVQKAEVEKNKTEIEIRNLQETAEILDDQLSSNISIESRFKILVIKIRMLKEKLVSIMDILLEAVMNMIIQLIPIMIFLAISMSSTIVYGIETYIENIFIISIVSNSADLVECLVSSRRCNLLP